MDVTLLYFEDCPHWRTADERVREAVVLSGRRDIVVRRAEVCTPEEADRLGFRGSPTVLIDGRDAFAAADAPVGLACRIYRTAIGPDVAPTVDDLVGVIGSV